jgi:deazaflavin-dependent oxidoreductase (nitroreductase family)
VKDRTIRRASRIHRVVFRATGGILGRRLVANDMLLLTTIGRRSGTRHTVPLLYLSDGDRLLVIASYGGRHRHPDWYLNLIEIPEVLVELPGTRRELRARALDPEERTVWWPRFVDAYEGYEDYQSRTEREIPVVCLE